VVVPTGVEPVSLG